MSVLISDLGPYPRNNRAHADADLAALMASIEEFGLRGRIQVRSREDPVIVNGHGRVEACRRLGWREIPDESIEFVGDLTDEQVRAYRIADNRTGTMAAWNRAALRDEVRGLAGFDMARFGVDFASARLSLPRGAERLRTDRAYNLALVSREDCGPSGFPELAAADARPARMRGFNFAKTDCEADKAGAACHFFLDDYQFERVWARPLDYVAALRGYDCVLTPDFSLYMDMPAPMQAWNRYRAQAVGLAWQRAGLRVVPTLSWAQPSSFRFCFDGVPRGSTVATSTVGAARDAGAVEAWRAGMREAMRRLAPARVLLYGADPGFDFGACEVVRYDARGFDGR